MKFIFLTMSILAGLCSNVFAVSLEQKWAEIKLNHQFHIVQPQFANAMGEEGVFNMCATQDEFKSLNPVRVCKEYKAIKRGNIYGKGKGYIEYRCAHWQTENVVIDRTTSKIICSQPTAVTEATPAGCFAYDTIEVHQPRLQQIEIVHGKGKLYMHHIAMKNYTIPECE